jgi:CBS domain-containing protein
MTKYKIRHIPIEKNNKLLGMVSIGDVVSRMVEKYQTETKLLREFISM